jgi:hypothetical protein
VPLALFPKARDTASMDNRKNKTPFAFTATASIKERRPMKPIKPATAGSIAILLTLWLTAYLVFNIATKGIQSIDLYDWYMFIMDISLAAIVIGAALTKMCE